MRKSNVKGFSLVELMVVVAIIGILAAVAIPNFQRFQRKARQSEAKGVLGGLHSAEAAFHGQWENYSTDLDGIGYFPDGNLRYRSGFAGAVAWSAAVPGDYTGAALTGAPFDTTGICALGGAMCMDASGLGAVPGAVAPAGFGDAAAFTAGAHGMIGGTMDDTWTITQDKVLTNVNDGTI